MQHKKEVIIPEKRVLGVDKVTCDFCYQEIEHTTSYEVNDVTMCSTCFTQKLVPWILREEDD